jgi:transposase InsO family protein
VQLKQGYGGGRYSAREIARGAPTFVVTGAGSACVFSVATFSRRIVGWRVASQIKRIGVLDAIEMARWSRGKHCSGSTVIARR